MLHHVMVENKRIRESSEEEVEEVDANGGQNTEGNGLTQDVVPRPRRCVWY